MTVCARCNLRIHRFEAINVAMGNTRVSPYSFCVDAHAGIDADIVSWEMVREDDPDHAKVKTVERSLLARWYKVHWAVSGIGLVHSNVKKIHKDVFFALFYVTSIEHTLHATMLSRRQPPL